MKKKMKIKNLIGLLIFIMIVAIWGPYLIQEILINAIKFPTTQTKNVNQDTSKE